MSPERRVFVLLQILLAANLVVMFARSFFSGADPVELDACSLAPVPASKTTGGPGSGGGCMWEDGGRSFSLGVRPGTEADFSHGRAVAERRHVVRGSDGPGSPYSWVSVDGVRLFTAGAEVWVDGYRVEARVASVGEGGAEEARKAAESLARTAAAVVRGRT